MADELETNLQLDIDDGVRRGLPPAEARREALLRMGGLAATKENLRERHGQPWLEITIRDAIYAFRTMRRTPGLTVTVLFTLALGIGATTAIFTVVSGVLLRPLPYSDPGRLVYISAKFAHSSGFSGYTQDYPAWRKYNRTLSQIAGYRSFEANMAGREGAERIHCGLATASLFSLLEVHPVLGRTFRPEEDQPGGPDVTLLTDTFWRSHFAADPAVVGKSLTLDDRVYTVVGVLPPSFRIPDRYGWFPYDVWVPFAIGENGKARDIIIHVVGRMRPGVTVNAVEADLTGLMRNAVRKGVRWKTAQVDPWQEQVASGLRRSLVLFLGAVGFLLLIACVNVANLLLGRSAARSREMAVRRALGAGTARIVRQLLTESVLLSLGGAALGLAAAHWTKGLVLLVIAPKMPSLQPIGLDYRVFAFTLAIAVVTGIAFGMAPAIAASRIHLMESLKEAGRGITGGRWKGSFRSALAVAEIALAMILLAGAGLFLRSFLEVRGIDLGVNPRQLLTFDISLTNSRYPKPMDQARYLERLLEALQKVPGVVSVAGGNDLPLSNGMMGFKNLAIEGSETVPEAQGAIVSSDFFRTMGIPLLRGRVFTSQDREDAPSVAVVSQTFARRFLAAGGGLGRRIQNPLRDDDWVTVAGVVGDVRPSPESEPGPMIYLPYLQPGQQDVTRVGVQFFSLVLRTSVPPMSIAPAVRRVAAAIDPAQAVYDVASFDDVRSEWVAPRRVNAILIGSFAGLALLLGSIGIYGVLSYAVGERSHEFGIRIALGARPKEITGMVLRSGIKVVACGVGLGLVGSLALARWISAELWGVRATDPWTLGTVMAILTAVGILACAIPARRAAKVDPLVALRCE
jgi:putative ABC transport system permease protein